MGIPYEHGAIGIVLMPTICTHTKNWKKKSKVSITRATRDCQTNSNTRRRMYLLGGVVFRIFTTIKSMHIRLQFAGIRELQTIRFSFPQRILQR